MKETDKLRQDMLSEIGPALHALDADAVDAVARLIASSGRVFTDGLGRSGLVARGLAMRLMQMGLDSQVVGETATTSFKEGDLLIIVSASGASPTLVNHAKKARELKGKTALISAGAGGELSDYTDTVLTIEAPDKYTSDSPSLQPMGTLFEQCAWLASDLIVLRLMEDLKLSSADMFLRHANIQ